VTGPGPASLSHVPTLAEVTAAADLLYPPGWAADWDAVGLVCGDPDAEVRHVHFAVDPFDATVTEALEVGADLLFCHHPLLLRGVHGVPAGTPKGRIVHRLVRAGVGLFTAHTNADVANPGVSDALAARLGLTDVRPIDPAGLDGGRGYGRIGLLPVAEPLSTFAERAAGVLPATAAGLRVAGDPDRPVHAVAVAGGAGDDLLDAVADLQADAYLTADLRHHPASERLAAGGPALLDASHWATEQPWLADAAGRLRDALSGTVETTVSTLPTDPWTAHHPTGANAP
jgi:dinuclear metal center YbgI/SA1388 family protein